MGLSSSSSALQTPLNALASLPEWIGERFGSERHQLPLFIPVAFGAGIGLWYALPSRPEWIAVICLLLALALGAVLVADNLAMRAMAAGSALAAAGLALAWWEASSQNTVTLEREVFGAAFEAEVLAVETLPARDRTRILIAPVSTGSLKLPEGLKTRVSVRRAPATLSVGDRVQGRFTLSPPPGPIHPGGYHFARRAWFEGIGATGYALGEVEIVYEAPPLDGAAARLKAFRERLTARLQDQIGGAAGGIGAALVTGDRGGIPDETSEAMRDSGLAHLIAISGLHIGVVVGGTLWLVKALLVRWEWFALRADARLAASLVAAVAGIAYTLVAGAGVPTIRACIAVLIVLLGLGLGREALSLRLVAAGATLILLWQPHLLLSPSFQLSFAAVTGIVALYQSPAGRRWREPSADGKDWPARLTAGAAALLATGLAAEAAIAPVALFHFGKVGLYGALANLIAIPLTSFAIIPLLILSLFADLLGVGVPLFAALKFVLGMLIGLAEWTASLPGSVASVPAIPPAGFVLMVMGGLWLCLWQDRWRLGGVIPFAAGILVAGAAPQPDLFVGPEGTHLAYRSKEGLAFLRNGAGSYVRDMWGGAAGSSRDRRLEDLDSANCSRDACVLRLSHGGRPWHVLATRSRHLIDRSDLEPLCRTSDIVVSDRWLPSWCRARWLVLDRESLRTYGAVSIDLDRGAVRSAALEDGMHPWAREQRAATPANGPEKD
ncbi:MULTISPECIES: ComEC/Rec2 family competence protein [Pacificimonas]|uniref:ComEC/Rec2 family competence protein n=1 Tax=Pacificimonas aurantium TaxID=1250540 RepID=A0ABS7WJQ4_9SPHN|nr:MULTISPECIES: ComEC/Rec2 family competence protein [Pacificimonas]MBZ6378623.1 ComEC/Rec2 family competence protein [Pacificimonas aurantium]